MIVTDAINKLESVSNKCILVSPGMTVNDWLKMLRRLRGELDFKDVFHNQYYLAYEDKIEKMFRDELCKEE